LVWAKGPAVIGGVFFFCLNENKSCLLSLKVLSYISVKKSSI